MATSRRIDPARSTDPATRGHHPDIARAAALIADPSRARILKSLGDGRSLSAKVLAAEAGVGAPTASAHLAKLVEAGLITAASVGRNRYYRLAGPEVSLALEALAMIAPPLPITSLRESSTANALRRSRTCYDHLAGRLGVAVMGGLIQHGFLTGHDGVHRDPEAILDRPLGYGHDHRYHLTDAGREALDDFGVDLTGLPARRQLVRYCVDWSEQQHHLAGGVGAALMARLFELGWLRYGASPRVVHLNNTGAAGIGAWLGLRLDDLVA